MLASSLVAKGKKPMLRESKKKRKTVKQEYPLKLYNNLHSAWLGGINPDSWRKFPDRGKKGERTVCEFHKSREHSQSSFHEANLALHGQAGVERRGTSLSKHQFSHVTPSLEFPAAPRHSQKKSTVFTLYSKPFTVQVLLT